MTSSDEASEFLQQHPEISHLDALLVDLCGQTYGKRLPRDHVSKLYEGGTPVCAAMTLVDVQGNTADPLGYGFSDGDPDAMVHPVPGRLVPVPWAPGLAQVLCTPSAAAGGEPLWYDPRTVLEGVVERFAELALRPVTAVELEFYLINPGRSEDGSPQPVRSPRSGARESTGKVLSLDKLDEYHTVIAAIEGACAVQGIPSTTMISEYGPGQFEINLAHGDDPVRACDDAVLLRRCIPSIARSHSMDATFMSVPFPGQAGSGQHVHVSLEGDEGNVLDPRRPAAEATLAHAVAGLQAVHGEAMALFAPNLNGYRRFVPDSFTPVTTDWGDNNRSVAFRIPPGPDSARRIEHRAAGAEANPYLVMAAVLAGIHHGLSARLAPGERHTGNAGSEADAVLPLKLWQALDAIRQARILPGYLGDRYCEIYADVKQAEFEAFMQTVSRQEYDWYL